MSGLELAGAITGSALAVVILLATGAVIGWTFRATSDEKELDEQTGDITARADQHITEACDAADARIKFVTDEANRRLDDAEQTIATLQQQIDATTDDYTQLVVQNADLTRQLMAERVEYKTVLTENEQLAKRNAEMTAELAKFGPLAADIPADANRESRIAKVWDDLTEPEPGPIGLTEALAQPPSTRAIRAANDPDSPEHQAAEAAIAALELQADTFDPWSNTQPAKPTADQVAAEYGPLPEATPVPTKRARSSRRRHLAAVGKAAGAA